MMRRQRRRTTTTMKRISERRRRRREIRRDCWIKRRLFSATSFFLVQFYIKLS